MFLWLKNILFVVLVPGTVAGYVPYRIGAAYGALAPDGGISRLAGLMLLALGAGVCLWCVWDFAATGRGTPVPIDPPRQLVVAGLYRYVRNPMYLGVLLVIAGWAVLFRSWAILGYAAAVGSGFHLFVVLFEEPSLRRKFGGSYVSYCEEVSRWIPRLRRR